MEIQLVDESRSDLAGRWRKPWVITALVTLALLSGVHGNGSGQRADAASPLLHDVAVVPIDDGFETAATFTGGECDNCADYFHRVTSDAHTAAYRTMRRTPRA
jgi:hypothetical protein